MNCLVLSWTYTSQSPAISLSSAPQCTLLSSHAQLTYLSVSGVKSDSVQLMLAWGWGGGDEGVGQNDDQSSRCPFLLITHYCATDSCQNRSSAEMRTKASINQEVYSSVWGRNPQTSSVPPTCLSDSWMHRPAKAEELPATLQLRWMKSLTPQWGKAYTL